MKSDDIDLREIKELAKRFTPEEIETCITDELSKGENLCLRDAPSERVINELSKAEFIRKLIDSGMSLQEALRELARRIRLIQKGG